MTPKEVLDVIAAGGALGMAGLVIVGFLFGWLHTRAELRERDDEIARVRAAKNADIAYERVQKEQALAIVKNALELLAEFRRDQRQRRKP